MTNYKIISLQLGIRKLSQSTRLNETTVFFFFFLSIFSLQNFVWSNLTEKLVKLVKMKINEKNLCYFATSPPVDREGWLQKRGEINKSWQRRYFVLKGNLLFYFEKKGDREPLGVIILEGCTIGERPICHLNRIRYIHTTHLMFCSQNWLKKASNIVFKLFFMVSTIERITWVPNHKRCKPDRVQRQILVQRFRFFQFHFRLAEWNDGWKHSPVPDMNTWNWWWPNCNDNWTKSKCVKVNPFTIMANDRI